MKTSAPSATLRTPRGTSSIVSESTRPLQCRRSGTRRLFETTWLGILLVDYDSGQVVDANPRIGTLIGHEAADLVGRLLWDLASFRALVSTEEGFASLRAHGPEPVAGVPLLHRDGQTVDVDVAVSGHTIDDTRVLQIVMRDVSNEKRHSAERDRLIAAIEQSGEEVMITDPRGSFSM